MIPRINYCKLAFGIWITYNTTLQASPGQLVFGREMIHNLRFQANWDRIRNNKQKLLKPLIKEKLLID
jgi:hypothetical protein